MPEKFWILGSHTDWTHYSKREALSYPVFSKKWLNVNVNVFARNILVWSEMKGFDPEASQGNDNMGGAFERFSLPGTASYGFGFNVKF